MKVFDLGGDEERFEYKAIVSATPTGPTTIFLRAWIENYNKVKLEIVEPEEVPQAVRDRYDAAKRK